jgi:hypothetical protein
MKLSVSLTALDLVLSKMGAAERNWQDPGSILDTIDFRERLRRGIEIKIDDISVLPDGLLAYQNEVVLLYIRDTYNDRDTLLHSPDNAVRFHIADCTWIEDRRRKGRLDRYVVTNSISGVFKVFAYDRFTRSYEPDPILAHLRVCKLCLMRINYKGSADTAKRVRTKIWEEFSIAEFLETHSPRFVATPKYNVDNAPPPGYPKGWSEESRTYRAWKQWQCECCGVDLHSNKALLHTHHINGVQGDNTVSNLKALCELCHAAQPDHRMRVSTRTIEIIHRLRREQEIPAEHSCSTRL